MDTFGRRGNFSAGNRAVRVRAIEIGHAILVGASESSIYDFLNQEYENKNPSKTLINIATLPVLIEKKTRNPFFCPLPSAASFPAPFRPHSLGRTPSSTAFLRLEGSRR